MRGFGGDYAGTSRFSGIFTTGAGFSTTLDLGSIFNTGYLLSITNAGLALGESYFFSGFIGLDEVYYFILNGFDFYCLSVFGS